jgi:hypothetical protein
MATWMSKFFEGISRKLEDSHLQTQEKILDEIEQRLQEQLKKNRIETEEVSQNEENR